MAFEKQATAADEESIALWRRHVGHLELGAEVAVRFADDCDALLVELRQALDTLKNGPLRGILETYRQEHPDDHLVLSMVIAEIQELASILPGDEAVSG